jgi:hypothetical protein
MVLGMGLFISEVIPGIAGVAVIFPRRAQLAFTQAGTPFIPIIYSYSRLTRTYIL